MKASIILLSLINLTSIFAATQCNQAGGQCGGKNWKGITCCPSGFTCKKLDSWYSQCLPKSDSNKKTSSKTKSNANAKNNQAAVTNNSSNSSTSSSSSSYSSNVIGYASMNGGCTGGKGGQTITVSNQSQLEAALKNTNAKIIIINGIIRLNNSDLTVTSNTSLIGANKNSGITNGGLKFKNAKNIIIQNLKFSYCLGPNADCINAQKSTNIWVDHCEFFNDKNHGKDYYDGLVDFTHASDFITLSWNYIHDHYKASLVGHSDSNGSEDTGKLHITYHHNYFKNVGSRLPSLRFGTGHIFNNVYENIENSSVNVRMGAQALVEGNVFRNASKPISTNLDSAQDGSVLQRNNDFGSTGGSNSITRTSNLNIPYYYSADSVNNVYNNVVRSAGPQYNI